MTTRSSDVPRVGVDARRPRLRRACGQPIRNANAPVAISFPARCQSPPSAVGQIAPGEQGNSSLKLVPVSDVGDAASYAEAGTIGAALDFAKRSNGLDVSVGMGPPATLAQIEPAEKALALEALARM